MIRCSMFTDMRPPPGCKSTPEHYDRVIGLVKHADDLGYHTVWTTEQHGIDDGYLPTQLPVLAAFARETERIRLGTGVILLPLAQPRRVVEEACVVDVFSHGRLTLGLGAGNYPHEFRAFGASLADRAEAMETGIAFVRQGLDGGPLPDGLPVNVPPAQARVPLVVGGLVKKAVDRAVRLADGHFGYAYVDPDTELPMQWRERIAPALEAHGRGPADFQLIFSSIIWPSDDYEAEWREHVGPAFLYQQRRYAEWTGDVASTEGYLEGDMDLDELRKRMLIGTPEEIADRLNAIRDVYPFHEVVIWPQLPGVPFELAEKCLRAFREEVAPRVRADDVD
jgi:alkanesulfonate monooxygenase SsuD/methylene tetrahydromethanopterin reductase-like flavin-dependent oxidoreductase (luciferase family)